MIIIIQIDLILFLLQSTRKYIQYTKKNPVIWSLYKQVEDILAVYLFIIWTRTSTDRILRLFCLFLICGHLNSCVSSFCRFTTFLFKINVMIGQIRYVEKILIGKNNNVSNLYCSSVFYASFLNIHTPFRQKNMCEVSENCLNLYKHLFRVQNTFIYKNKFFKKKLMQIIIYID